MKKQTSGKGIIVVWILLINLLGATIVAEFITGVHAVYSLEGQVIFHGWYGAIICIAVIVIAKFLGFFLKRQESYYKEGRND